MSIPSTGLRRLSIVTVVATYLLIVWGGVVRVSGSGLGCGAGDDWPLCHGRYLPPLERTALIEFTHRWLAAVATTLVVILAAACIARWASARRAGRGRAATLAGVVIVLFVAQIALGAATVKLRLPGYVIAVHLANALILLGTLVVLSVRLHAAEEGTLSPADTSRQGMGLAAGAAAAVYALALSGAVVVAGNAGAGCGAWPLCGNGVQWARGDAALLNLTHRFVAGAVVLFVGYALAVVRRAHRDRAALRGAVVVANVLLLAQVVVGALVATLHLPPIARGVHLALGSALWATVVLVAALARIPGADGVLDVRGSVVRTPHVGAAAP